MTTISVRETLSPTLTIMEPLLPTFGPLDEMDELVPEVWDLESWAPVDSLTHMHSPLDVYEEKDELVIKTELPGMRKKDIDISLEGDCLTITGEKKPEEISEEATYYSCERCFGTYSRSVSLPFPVDAEKIVATFENGLLKIRLPRAEEAEGKRKHIQIKAAPRVKVEPLQVDFDTPREDDVSHEQTC